MTDCLVCLSIFIYQFILFYSAGGPGCSFTHEERDDVTRKTFPLCDNTVCRGDPPPAQQRTHARAGAPTHLECASTTLGSNRCRSFTLNYRRQRRSEGTAHSLRCERAAWREPEQETPAIIGRKPAVCSFQWCGCRGLSLWGSAHSWKCSRCATNLTGVFSLIWKW